MISVTNFEIFLKKMSDDITPQSVSFLLSSRSKSNTSSLVSSVPFLLPAAHTSRVSDALIRHTTPPVEKGGRTCHWMRLDEVTGLPDMVEMC